MLYEGAMIDFNYEPAMLTEEQIKELSDHATQSGESLLAYPKSTFKGPGQVRYLTGGAKFDDRAETKMSPRKEECIIFI